MYRLTLTIDVDGAPAPVRSNIQFDLPGDVLDAQVALIARGIRKAFRDAYEERVKVVELVQTDLTRAIPISEGT